MSVLQRPSKGSHTLNFVLEVTAMGTTVRDCLCRSPLVEGRSPPNHRSPVRRRSPLHSSPPARRSPPRGVPPPDLPDYATSTLWIGQVPLRRPPCLL